MPRLINTLLTREEIYLGIRGNCMTSGYGTSKLDSTAKPHVSKKHKVVRDTQPQNKISNTP